MCYRPNLNVNLLRGTTFSNLRNRQYFPSTIAFGAFQYRAYCAMLRQLFYKYSWTSIAVVYDANALSTQYYTTLTQQINAYFTLQAVVQITTYPVYSGTRVDYEETIRKISKSSRSTCAMYSRAFAGYYCIYCVAVNSG